MHAPAGLVAPGSATRLASLLRAATAASHERTEAAADLPGRLGSVAGFAGFLAALEAVHRPLEAELAPLADGDDVPALLRADRERAGHLRADLATLGFAPAARSAATPALPTDAHRRGAWYVLEGSRLGGPSIVRAVGRHLPEALPATTALRPSPALGARWRTFRTWLDTGRPDEDDLVLAGATATFDALGRALRA